MSSSPARRITAAYLVFLALTPYACHELTGPIFAGISPEWVDAWYDRLALFWRVLALGGPVLLLVAGLYPKPFRAPRTRVVLVVASALIAFLAGALAVDPWIQVWIRDSQVTSPDVIAHPLIAACAYAVLLLALLLFVSLPSEEERPRSRTILELAPAVLMMAILLYLAIVPAPEFSWS